MTGAIVVTPLGRFRVVDTTAALRGNRVDGWKFECPVCGEWDYLDDDQWHGRVSVDHTDTGCTYHETHDYDAVLGAV